MKFLNKTLEYLFLIEKGKRFLILFLLSLPMGFFASLAMPSHIYVDWIKNFDVGNNNFLDALQLAGTQDYKAMIIGVVGVIIFGVITLAMMATIISRSLRVGIFKPTRLIREFNESFFPALYVAIIYIPSGIVLKIVFTVFLVFWQSANAVATGLALSIITMLLFFLIVAGLIAVSVLFMPYMTINGINPFHAFHTSFAKCTGETGLKLLVATALPIIAIIVAGAMLGFVEVVWVQVLVESLLYAMLYTYLVALSFIAYYEINALQRVDYPRDYILYRGKK